MVFTTLKEFGTGQVTLPKEWRDKFKTNLYFARETKQGLLIRPIVYDESDFAVIEYDDGKYQGLHFPQGIPAGILANQLKQAYEAIHQDPKKITKKSSKKRPEKSHS